MKGERCLACIIKDHNMDHIHDDAFLVGDCLHRMSSSWQVGVGAVSPTFLPSAYAFDTQQHLGRGSIMTTFNESHERHQTRKLLVTAVT